MDTSDPVGHHALAAQTVDSDDVDEDGHRGAIPHGFIFAAFMVEFLHALVAAASVEMSGVNDSEITNDPRVKYGVGVEIVGSSIFHLFRFFAGCFVPGVSFGIYTEGHN